ncbi:AraC-type DNA-binding protein [Flexibacter flexilis DSM 6793]|uniref:AraC-type DNA-binding protein n=1 Tax=Flexibacter flexilis DSM 6793 TaxID=927664 RepID=A0A1I1IQJ0_9BACT|nr:helix-turn-helix domain-containing protein [Flexibacter flexilis]SFC38549.1 AraC-type DNA-binding protein [Flexibacter flexilis DSM 6793]
MTKETLHEAFSVVVRRLDQCPQAEHQHHFFELIYIIEGTGLHHINKNAFNYHAGHLFLITPEDIHSFDIQAPTTFFYLRFNNIYLKEGGLSLEGIRHLEFILQNANHQPSCILKNQPDKALVKPIVEAIVREQENAKMYNRELIEHLINTLIVVVVRNISMFQRLDVSEQTEQKAIDILHYIQTNIYTPDKLKASHLSQQFNLSNHYLGRYFKAHTGETMQEYINHYRTKLIEHRLKHSDKRISEIVQEFNFTDESHLNKFFKKQLGYSPRDYRTQNKVAIAQQ